MAVKALQEKLGLKPVNTLHIGDQWVEKLGNDFSARQSATSLWVTKPSETLFFLQMLLNDLMKLNKT